MNDFPTGKPHVSYSEIKNWKECSYRHKLLYVDGLQEYNPSPYADFGTALHNAIESFLKTKEMNIEKCLAEIDEAWRTNLYEGPEYLEKMKDHSWYKNESVDTWKSYAKTILESFPNWMDNEFLEWELVDAEHELYEKIQDESISFKGFVDCIIKAKSKRGKDLLWVIDWKTTGKYGWIPKKKRDFLTTAQVGFYKKYISRKLEIELKDIRCAYVFLKRGASPEKCIESFTVSVGPKFLEKTDKLLNSMIKSVRKGMALKNYSSCKFCPFTNTEHCSGKGW